MAPEEELCQVRVAAVEAGMWQGLRATIEGLVGKEIPSFIADLRCLLAKSNGNKHQYDSQARTQRGPLHAVRAVGGSPTLEAATLFEELGEPDCEEELVEQLGQ